MVFTDASQRFGIAEYELDALEHSSRDVLCAFDLAARKVTLLRVA